MSPLREPNTGCLGKDTEELFRLGVCVADYTTIRRRVVACRSCRECEHRTRCRRPEWPTRLAWLAAIVGAAEGDCPIGRWPEKGLGIRDSGLENTAFRPPRIVGGLKARKRRRQICERCGSYDVAGGGCWLLPDADRRRQTEELWLRGGCGLKKF